MSYKKMVNMALFGQRGAAWVWCKLVSLQSEIWEFRNDFEEKIALRCSYDLFTLKRHLLDYLVDKLNRFGSSLFTNVGPLEHFDASLKRFLTVISLRVSTKMHETVESMRSALDSVRRSENKKHGVFLAHLYCGKESVEKMVRSTLCMMRLSRF